MDAVIAELKLKTIEYIVWHFGADYLNNCYWYEYVRNKKHEVSDSLTQSPFWLYKMDYRYNYDIVNVFNNINDRVRYDYALALNELDCDIKIELSDSEKNTYMYKIRQNMWAEAQKEKMLMFYNKIPNDILNVILTFM
jgi:hypothetical protein